MAQNSERRWSHKEKGEDGRKSVNRIICQIEWHNTSSTQSDYGRSFCVWSDIEALKAGWRKMKFGEGAKILSMNINFLLRFVRLQI